jgi:hypothetical protein
MTAMLLRFFRMLAVFVRCAGTTNPRGVGMFLRHLTVLLIALIGGVLFDISLPTLLGKIALRLLCLRRGMAWIGLWVTAWPLWASVGGWNWRHVCHEVLRF